MALESFIKVDPGCHFPIQNLPYGIFKPRPFSQPRPGVAIGDYVLDLSQISSARLFHGTLLQNSDCFHQPTLNKFIELGPLAWTQARSTLQTLLSSHQPTLRDNPTLRQQALVPLPQAQLLLPISIPNYTDFFSSLHHAQNCTTLFLGPHSPLHPNWYSIPLAYHGRASSIVVSGTDITRPIGITPPPPGNRSSNKLDSAPELTPPPSGISTTPPSLGPSKKSDSELGMTPPSGISTTTPFLGTSKKQDFEPEMTPPSGISTTPCFGPSTKQDFQQEVTPPSCVSTTTPCFGTSKKQDFEPEMTSPSGISTIPCFGTSKKQDFEPEMIPPSGISTTPCFGPSTKQDFQQEMTPPSGISTTTPCRGTSKKQDFEPEMTPPSGISTTPCFEPSKKQDFQKEMTPPSAISTTPCFEPSKKLDLEMEASPLSGISTAPRFGPSKKQDSEQKTKPRPSEISTAPWFGPSKKLDFELEVGAVVGVGNEMGERVGVEEGEEHIFGLVLMNDWSARDIQGWESVPLGPFLGKSFATTISPWIVTTQALRPFGCEAPIQAPPPAEYLKKEKRYGYDISLEVGLRPGGGEERRHVVCRSNMRNLYWSLCQQVAHHTVNGCNLQVGDVLGSGTISGEEEHSFGSLLELTWDGRKPISLGGGGGDGDGCSRGFLEDGDEVVITGWCSGDGYVVGFGECRAAVLPSRF